jgi:hypothetical protein
MEGTVVPPRRAQKGLSVPLSPEEQRILQDIEKSFYEHDPQFAREVSSTTLYKVAGRNLKWLALGFLAGLVILLVSFTTSLFFGGLGFVIMLACAFFFERNLRKMGRAGWASLTSTVRSGGIGTSFGSAGKRVRDRFKRSD